MPGSAAPGIPRLPEDCRTRFMRIGKHPVTCPRLSDEPGRILLSSEQECKENELIVTQSSRLRQTFVRRSTCWQGETARTVGLPAVWAGRRLVDGQSTA